MPYIKVANYEFTTPPAGVVVTLDEVKQNARVDFSDEDTIIQIYIDSAVDRINKLTNRLLQPAVLNGFYPYPDTSRFEERLFVTLERAPITAVNEVAIWDGTAYAALTTDQWEELKTSTYSRIWFNSTVIFNANLNFDDLIPYPIRVGFNAGYADASAIPPALKLAIIQYATWLYNTRGDCSDCDPSSMRSLGGFMFPKSIADLVSSFIIRRVFG